MNTAPDLAMPTTVAAIDSAKAAAAPRIRLSSHGFSIDHPDPVLGEQLMANALGVTDREARHHRAERLGRGWRQGHCRQRHAACERDRCGQEPGIRGAEGTEGRRLQARASFR